MRWERPLLDTPLSLADLIDVIQSDMTEDVSLPWLRVGQNKKKMLQKLCNFGNKMKGMAR